MMPEHADCALPKTESGWMGGVQMKEKNTSGPNREIERWKRELQKIPEPNFGRLEELREKIRKKILLTKEAVEEAAERIAARFFGKE